MKKKHKKKKILKLTILFVILDIIALSCFILMYGPNSYLRNTLVNTAMNTMEHQWIAKVFFSDEIIQ